MRKFLAILALIPLAASANDRLLGTWKSDREESMRFDEAHALLEPKQTKFLSQVLGHLEMSFDGKHVRSTMPDLAIESNGKPTTFHGTDESHAYRVLGTDLDSVAVYVEKEFGRDRILHIHFVGENAFWLYSEESDYGLRELNTREYFHRK